MKMLKIKLMIILLCLNIFINSDELSVNYKYISSSTPNSIDLPQQAPYFVAGNAYTISIW